MWSEASSPVKASALKATPMSMMIHAARLRRAMPEPSRSRRTAETQSTIGRGMSQVRTMSIALPRPGTEDSEVLLSRERMPAVKR